MASVRGAALAVAVVAVAAAAGGDGCSRRAQPSSAPSSSAERTGAGPRPRGAGPAPTPSFPYPGDTPAGAWSATFWDDFDGPALNASAWRVRANESHCEPCELQLYVPGAVAVAGGALVVTTARAHAFGPGGAVFNFTSGWVDTGASFAQLRGLWEARAALPAPASTGTWPAFWTLPANQTVCWPTEGEIDVFEYLADAVEDAVFGSFRWGTACGVDNAPLPGGAWPPAGGPPVDWTTPHVFAAAWTAAAITFFVDGHAYVTVRGDDVPLPAVPHLTILNTAVAPFWPPGAGAEFPATTTWDWVRVYEWVPG
jgi:beta-glucanase (GH16 family)